MKIAIAQLNYHIGNFEYNFRNMTKAIKKAKAQGSDIISFSELSTCGYPPRDFLEFDHFIDESERVVEELKELSRDIAIVVGSPSVNPVPEGKDLFNSGFFLADGKILHIGHKSLLPTYDIFDEYRYFEPGRTWEVIKYKELRIALTICEDIWNIANENPLYTNNPMDELTKQKPDLILNLSASPFSYTHAKVRIDICKENVKRYKVPLFYVNHSGAHTDIIFDGGSLVLSAEGAVFDEMPYFDTCVRTYNFKEVRDYKGKDKVQDKEKTTLIYNALVYGVKEYFDKLNFDKAILGLSGGIDSAVTAVIAAEALGSENVRAMLMPSHYSSDHSVLDAKELAENLGIEYDIIPIEKVYHQFDELLDPLYKGLPFDVTEENIQARIRGVLLMAISNKHGYILLNTSNKSEMAVGYGTLYGDLAGGLSVLGDVYKTEVFKIAEYINGENIVIPENTITKPPSAELRPDQKDTDSLPPYDILDEILFRYIEKREGPRKIVKAGYDPDLVKRILKLVNHSEFKRHQTAPVLRVSDKAFGMGRRMPIVAQYLES